MSASTLTMLASACIVLLTSSSSHLPWPSASPGAFSTLEFSVRQIRRAIRFKRLNSFLMFPLMSARRSGNLDLLIR